MPSALLDQSKIRVWWLLTDANPTAAPEWALSAFRAVLEPAERAKADHFVDARDHRDYVAAHALTRGLLAASFGVPAGNWRFEAPPLRKPIVTTAVRAGQIVCSLTHTRGFVAAAIALDQDVGIDAEPRDHDRLGSDIAGLICTPRECAALQRLDQDPVAWRRALVQLWVEKEAFAKALGLGLSMPLASFEFDELGRVTFLGKIGQAGESRDWRRWRPQTDRRFCVAVVAQTRERPVDLACRRITWRSLYDHLT